MSIENRRQFVSFGEACAFKCNHCYTFSDGYKIDKFKSIQDIVESIKGKSFDIIYVSGHRENFVDPDDGLSLCEQLFDEYNVDMLITTRNVFNEKQLLRLKDLYGRMKAKDKDLFFCSSIPATDSYKKLEPSSLIPSPVERMDFLKQVFLLGIYTILTIRPLCPDGFIPIKEPLEIIDLCHSFSTVVLSSGVVVDKHILEKLKCFPKFECNGEESLMQCLENNISVKYVDVGFELEAVRNKCEEYEKKLFYNSGPAIEYIKSERHNLLHK